MISEKQQSKDPHKNIQTNKQKTNTEKTNKNTHKNNNNNNNASQCAPAVWTEVKERPEVTRDGNSRVARLNTSTFPSLQPVTVGCIVWQPVRLKRTGTSHRIIICTRVHLHIVFVLLCSVCRSVSVLSCVDVIRSFTYVLRVVIWTSLKDVGREHERKREAITNGLSHVPSKRTEEIKSGTSGCGSFVIPYFEPATSIDRLHIVWTILHNHTGRKRHSCIRAFS